MNNLNNLSVKRLQLGMFHGKILATASIFTGIYRNLDKMARPPARSDADLAALIAELSSRSGKPTGTALREELRRRFGVRCGTQRIYRLLATPSPPVAHIGTLDESRRLAALTAERDAALARAELAEMRERSHLDKWANEIHDLRHEVARLRRGGPSR